MSGCRDLEDTYFPAFQACVAQGAGSFMSSYNSINGTPSVANPWLLDAKLRREWGFQVRGVLRRGSRGGGSRGGGIRCRASRTWHPGAGVPGKGVFGGGGFRWRGFQGRGFQGQRFQGRGLRCGVWVRWQGRAVRGGRQGARPGSAVGDSGRRG